MPTPFCTITDAVNLGVPLSAFGSVTAAQKQACIDYANAYVGSKLAGRYPGINLGGSGWTWDTDVTGAAVAIAIKRLLDVRGRNPSAVNADRLIDDNAKAAEQWITDVQKQAIHPAITGGETAGATSQGPVVVSTTVAYTQSGTTATNRGW